MWERIEYWGHFLNILGFIAVIYLVLHLFLSSKLLKGLAILFLIGGLGIIVISNLTTGAVFTLGPTLGTIIVGVIIINLIIPRHKF